VVVDDVVDTQEIVVKPVGRRVRPIGCYAGCTILGDGRVIMILDAGGIAALSGIRATGVRAAEAPAAPAERDRDTLLLFDAGHPALQVVPLSRVARLEEIPASRIEHVDGRYVVQYRGSLLPVVAASPSVNVTSGQTRSVIVFNDGATSFGLAVNEIRDIVEDRISIELAPARPGVLGTAVVAGAATEVIDVAYFGARSRGVAA
jgi:two-component system chemotaxis sensor kinase CheA